ncbi:MAG: protein-L-isoaspartate(D-aspartate) O-methyltransferase [Clostridia bacterium]|nr:protein-L-isoaspartate(D-aspartate) O-methyltransferase [Clostridia bacterium]NCC75740.1 protein-L-isoaspartate(D-aspartate) O-methyltransferase [Clostridia bacterium]
MDNEALWSFFHQLDRTLFLDDEYKPMASVDGPLPIGYGQTISQPSLVVEMTRILDISPDSTVLEIGTGSGYQTALLAHFAHEVYTIERITELSVAAQDRLDRLGLTNIRFKIGDGSLGWPEHAPFDRIMVTAAAGRIPDELFTQLRTGGRMIIPVGPPSWQQLLLITKDAQGLMHRQPVENVRFVELHGKYGWGHD